MEKTKIYPHRGWLLVEVLKDQSAGKIALPEDAQEERSYGKVLEIGKPLIKEGGVVEGTPSFAVETNEEGLGGKEHKLKKGDIIIFKKLTQHGITQYTSDNEIAFVNFDSILGLRVDS